MGIKNSGRDGQEVELRALLKEDYVLLPVCGLVKIQRQQCLRICSELCSSTS